MINHFIVESSNDEIHNTERKRNNSKVQKLLSYRNLANVERSKLMFPPKAKKIKSKPERDSKVMELFWSPLPKRYKQWRKIGSRLYIFCEQ